MTELQSPATPDEAREQFGPFRIALVLGTLEVGGTETQVCRFAAELLACGHEVRVFAQSGGGPLEGVLKHTGVPYSTFKFRGVAGARAHPLQSAEDLRPLFAMWREIRRWHPHVCQAYLFQGYLWTMPASRALGVPVRVACRRGLAPVEPMSRFASTLLRLANQCTTFVVANSDAVAASVRDAEQVRPNRLRVIRNGVHLPPTTADVGLEPAVGLMVANFIHYKGHDDLVAAMASLKDPPVIRLVGGGPEQARLAMAIGNAGLASVLPIDGMVPGAHQLWQDAQFGVLASHVEGLPNAVMEAMAAGVPVVATAVGGVTELIEDGVSGMLVPPHDPPALASAINHLSRQPEVRTALGTAARRRAQMLDWPTCTDAYLRLYEQTLCASTSGVPRRPRIPAS